MTTLSYYTRRCTISMNTELHKKTYNNNKHFLIHESVYRLIQDDI